MVDPLSTGRFAALHGLADLSAALLAVDPFGLGGAVLLNAVSGQHDAWAARFLALLPAGSPSVRIPPGTPDDRLVGGLDVAATLRSGRAVLEPGVLARANGGVAMVPGAERMGPAMSSRLAEAMDDGVVRVERDGLSARLDARCALLLFDESAADEGGVSAALADRVGLHLDLRLLGTVKPPDAFGTLDRERILGARAYLALQHEPSPESLREICGLADELGVESMRAPLLALRAARAGAALLQRPLGPDDLALAVVLVLAPRATRPLDLPGDDPPPPADPPDARDDTLPDSEAHESEREADAPERRVDPVRVRLTPGLLEEVVARSSRRAGTAGRAGIPMRDPWRGRRVGTRPGDPRRARLDLIGTIRAAAPRQRPRRAEEPTGPAVRLTPGDLRVRVHDRARGTTVVFAVDASGSQALNRLAEAKGAIELLLAESYARRDRVALVAFRGTSAELVLPPTRSLARVRRGLAALPGGGGTPMAAGLDAAAQVCAQVERSGDESMIVILTDGRANVTRAGVGGRAQAESDAVDSARALRRAGLRGLLIDTAPRPHPFARRLAQEMAGRYLALPVGDPRAVGAAVQRARSGAT
jgi:magnesium chelatase subunit D